jgi:hypothetical protein
MIRGFFLPKKYIQNHLAGSLFLVCPRSEGSKQFITPGKAGGKVKIKK